MNHNSAFILGFLVLIMVLAIPIALIGIVAGDPPRDLAEAGPQPTRIPLSSRGHYVHRIEDPEKGVVCYVREGIWCYRETP